MTKVQQFMLDNKACQDGGNWAEQYSTLAEVWDNCQRGDWQIWLADKADVLTQEIAVEFSTWSAARVLHVFEEEYPHNKSARNAIDAAKAWLKNPCEETRAAAKRAACAAYVAYAADAADAAYAAAFAVADAAYAVAYAADAAYAVADAAYATDAAARAAENKEAEQLAQAEKLREMIANPFRKE